MADGRYHSDKPLTYSAEMPLQTGNIVSVPLRGRTVSAFVSGKVAKPTFATKPVKSLLSESLLPKHILPFAGWLQSYYATNIGDCLRQFAPTKPIIRRKAEAVTIVEPKALEKALQKPLTADQKKALAAIAKAKSTTVLLHGETGTGKTRVYLEMAQKTLAAGRSVIILTPEIALTAQLAEVVRHHLDHPVYILHSELPEAQRKKIWLAILEADQPVVVLGPRSALFAPVQQPGLIVVDEAHEPAYKQQQSPRYQAVRAASQLGALTGAKVILGSATPSLVDYHLANEHRAIVRMTQMAAGESKVKIDIVDLKDKSKLSSTPYLSKPLIEALKQSLAKGRQAMVYLNRRGSARIILCNNCGWQLLCPNCDIPLVYHADKHLAICHTCGHQQAPPTVCPQCANPDIIYKSAGTKTLADELGRLFPEARIARFDSDNDPAERLNQLYPALRSGEIDILVGTQLLAKGLDLPKLGLVGVVAAETALALPDFTSEERSFQLLYQVIGRVGRGHSAGQVVVQTYEPDSAVIKAATKRDYKSFYDYALKERQLFGFPPFCYLLRLSCRRLSAEGAEKAALKLLDKLQSAPVKASIIGPSPAFYARRGRYHFWQLVVKAKRRDQLLELAKLVPADWSVDLDPADLL